MSDHECPAPDCSARVPSEQLACRTHWYGLSKPTRDRVWAAYRSGDADAHRAAVADAIDELRAAVRP